jgi:hypothetical protein
LTEDIEKLITRKSGNAKTRIDSAISYGGKEDAAGPNIF